MGIANVKFKPYFLSIVHPVNEVPLVAAYWLKRLFYLFVYFFHGVKVYLNFDFCCYPLVIVTTFFSCT